jgi:DNA-binding SARP family transcriptional activator/tetratricopeptide (TPR) repeat protein
MGRKREGTGMVRVRVLGAIELQVGHRRIGMNTEVLFGLALYLTTRAGERVPREQLLDLFWAKGGEEQRRHALRQMMYRLRQKGIVLDEDGEYVRIDTVRVDSDLRRVLASGWDERAAADEVDAAAQFSPVFSRRMAPAFLEWIDEIRDRVTSQHRKASLRQITVARREGRWADLERWAQSVLRSDPLNEEATLARAESAAMAGSKTTALEILDTYLAEVGEISPELGKPALALRKRLAERRADWTLRGPKEVALIGRTELMSRLTGLVDAAWRGEGGAVVLVGAPGIGKTRLAMEARAYAELKGMRTVVVRAEAAQRERPLAVVLSFASAVLDLPGAAGGSPDHVQLLRRLTSTVHAAKQLIATASDSLRPALVDAVEDVLAAVSTEVRVLIVFDDLHLADEFSVSAIASLVGRFSRSRLSWIATARAQRPQDAQLGSDAGWSRSVVPPLGQDASEHLAAEVLRAHRIPFDSLDSSRIAERAGGNPLFVRELSAHRASTTQPESLPTTLADLMGDKLGRLDDAHLHLLRLVTVLGSCATIGRLSRITEGSPVSLPAAVERLEGDGILALDAKGLRLHETWQQAVADSMGAATKSSLALLCAESIYAGDHASLSVAEAWKAAELYSQAGEVSRAHELYVSAADALLRQGLPDEAASILMPTLSRTRSRPGSIAIRRRLAEAYHALGNVTAVIDVTDSILDLQLEDGPAQSTIDFVVAICHRTEALARAHRSHTRELEHIRRAASNLALDETARRFACYTGIRRALNIGDRRLAQEFFDCSESISALAESATAWLVRLIHAAELGSHADVLRADAALEDVPWTTESLTLKCNTLRFRSYALRMAGDYERAVELGKVAFTTARSSRQLEVAGNVAEGMTFLFLDVQDLTSAREWLSQWTELAQLAAYPMREKGLRHAQVRLALQEGRFREAWRAASEQLAASRATSVASQRLGEVMTAAAAALGAQDWPSATELVGEYSGEVASANPSFLMDYPAELCVRVLRAIGRTRAADDLATGYLARRSLTFRRPLPPFCTQLGEARP